MSVFFDEYKKDIYSFAHFGYCITFLLVFLSDPDKKTKKKVAPMNIKTHVLWHRLEDYKKVAAILKNNKAEFEHQSEFYSSGVLFFGNREELIHMFKNHEIYISQAAFYQILNVQAKQIIFLTNGDVIFDNASFQVVHTLSKKPHQVITSMQSNPPFLVGVKNIELLDSEGWYLIEDNNEPLLPK